MTNDDGPAATKVDLSEVVKRHIFGVVPAVKKPVVEKPKKVVEAPKTKLKLKLTGVITAIKPEHSHAMIEIQKGKTSVVRVGDKVGKTGAVLLEVNSGHILIEYQGKPEKLEIVRPGLSLTDPSSQNEKTITDLNINIAEFEALARVDPKDLDISRLLPDPATRDQKGTNEVSQSADVGRSNIDAINEQQLRELEEMERQEEIVELEQLLLEGGLGAEEKQDLEYELLQLRTES